MLELGYAHGRWWEIPTVLAIAALRLPSGLDGPMVVSTAVWCSSSAFNFAPHSTMTAHIHIIRPMATPSEAGRKDLPNRRK
jgi:hypothetical protein